MRLFLLSFILVRLHASSLFDLYTPDYAITNMMWFYSSPYTLQHLREKSFDQEKNAQIAGFTEHRLRVDLSGTYRFGYFRESRANFWAEPGIITLLSQGAVGQFSLQHDGTTLPLNGTGEIYSLEGIFLERKLRFANLYGALKVKFLNGLEYHNVIIDGEAARSNGTTDFAFDVSHHYYQNNLLTNNPIYRMASPQATGYSVDLDLTYHYEGIELQFGGKNLVSHITWKNLIYYTAVVNSETVYTGEDGFRHVRPLVQGQYLLHQKVTTPLQKDYYLTLTKQLDAYTLSAGRFDLGFATVYAVQLQHRNLQLAYTETFDTLSIGYTYKNYYLDLSSNVLDYRQAQHLLLSMGYSF